MKDPSYFPGFKYPSSELKKFVFASEIFSIMLSSGDVVHFKPDDVVKFRKWLWCHNIEEIRTKNGK
ncbi:hypothetical protein [Niabella beijingensis]|uniref:hypothetical protein n=1 Tax=Niabella beijingensis TaxID=2872700 RepID=UPI001CC04A1B|nr:hypothetical protein [Niabella beijingensis]MBZ4188962.1 hypothetical protein [Niabella beijingensis]